MDLDKGNNEKKEKKRKKNGNVRKEVIVHFLSLLRFFGCKSCSPPIFLIYYSRLVFPKDSSMSELFALNLEKNEDQSYEE